MNSIFQALVPALQVSPGNWWDDSDADQSWTGHGGNDWSWDASWS